MKIQKKKSLRLGVVAFLVMMLLLMIDDAANHPEDFKNGFNFFEQTNQLDNK